MKRKKPLCIVNYAVNGLGLGHLTRLVAINREVRRLCILAGIPFEIFFLTSSEGDALCYANGFASFKIPSKNAVRTTGLSPTRYKRTAKQWIWNAVNMTNPDILVVDTFPGGAFDELYDILDFGQHNVFVYRAVKHEVASTPRFQSLLGGYHSVLSIGEQGVHSQVIPATLHERTHMMGEILLLHREEILPRNKARQLLGLNDYDQAVYISSGGGGDTNAEQILGILVETLRQFPNTVFVVGSGHLYRGREYHAPNIRWTQRMMMMECFSAFDAAVTAGGFNTINELMYCGIPCVILPQSRNFDDQFARAERIANQGAGLVVNELSAEQIANALRYVLDNRTAMSDAAHRSVPTNAATDAAAALLQGVVQPSLLDHAVTMRQSRAYSSAMALLGNSDEQDALTLLHTLDAALRRSRITTERQNTSVMDFDDDECCALLSIVEQSQGINLRTCTAALRRMVSEEVYPPDGIKSVLRRIIREQEDNLS